MSYTRKYIGNVYKRIMCAYLSIFKGKRCDINIIFEISRLCYCV